VNSAHLPPAPDYACAVIADARGWLILQLRPQSAKIAALHITCFGGRRENGESALDCLRRELDEEIGWRPPAATPCCELWRGRRFIARFYAVQHPDALIHPQRQLRVEAGQVAIAAPWAALPGLPLSPWHRAVLMALRQGETRVEI